MLAALLYRGQRITDDHQMGQPRNWLTALKGDSSTPSEGGDKKPDPLDIRKKPRQSGANWSPSIDLGGTGDEGCLVLLGIVVAAIVLFFALWFLIEIAIPVVVFVLYCIARGMLATVINDRHHCRGRLGKSLLWALAWATLYTAPLAGVVWAVHYVLTRQPAA